MHNSENGVSEMKFKAAGTSVTSTTDNRNRREILIDSGPGCWVEDYESEIAQHPFGRYSELRELSGERVEYAAVLSTFKLIVRVKSQLEAIVEVRCWAMPLDHGSSSKKPNRSKKTKPSGSSVNSRDENIRKLKLNFEQSISQAWNKRFKLKIVNPGCATRILPITYKIVWDEASPHYTLWISPVKVREKVANGVVVLSEFSLMQTYAHEFAHCLGVPDEYANALENRIVNYYRPDGTLAPDIIALTTGYEKNSTDPNGNIMSQKGSTKVELRHAWNIAIEAQALLRAKIGREIQCDILRAE